MLKSERVSEIFMDCLSQENEESIKIEGIAHDVIFNPTRLEKYRKEVFEMLKELPENFMKSKGGGWSFLNACLDKNGDQWTSFHLVMEQLFLLGLGLKLVESVMPKNMWKMFPGGMPYYVVLDE
jgi:hypothetical protein